MTAPAAVDVWGVLGGDDDIVADLRAIGIELRGSVIPTVATSADQSYRDAMASMFLRRQSLELAAVTQLEESRDLELRGITQRYENQIQQRSLRISQLSRAVEAIAEQTKLAGGYDGKKKSRDVGSGSYGYRTYSDGLELRDEPAFITWAEEHAPEVLRVKPTLTLAVAREFLSPTELEPVKREVKKAEATTLATSSLELPPGFVKAPATNEFYAKPIAQLRP